MKSRIWLALSFVFVLMGFSVSTAQANGNERLKVGISLVDLSNPFFSILAEEISLKLESRSKRSVEILVRSSAYDLKRQVEQLNGFIQEEVDILFIAASETNAIAPVVKQARKRGIIVVAVDIESVGADISVSSDNFQAGELACRYLANRLSGKGKVAIINGSPVSSVIYRVNGCRNVLEKFQQLELVSFEHNSSGTFSGGLESMTYLLLEYPDLKGVFTINDPSALGAEEALKQMGIKHLVITSVDGSPEVLERLKNGKTNLIGSAAQFPRIMARKAVELALRKLSGEVKDSRVEQIQTKLITADNADRFGYWEELERK